MSRLDLIEIVVIVLAVARGTILIVDDKITAPLRHRINVRAANNAGPLSRFAAAMIGCIWCASVWVGLAAVAAVLIGGLVAAVAWYVMAALALSLAAVAIHAVFDIATAITDYVETQTDRLAESATPPAPEAPVPPALRDLE